MAWKIHKKYVDRKKLIKRSVRREGKDRKPHYQVEPEDLRRGTPYRRSLHYFRMSYYYRRNIDTLRWERLPILIEVNEGSYLYTPVESEHHYVTRISQEEFWELEEKEAAEDYDRHSNLDRGRHSGSGGWKEWTKLRNRQRRSRTKRACEAYLMGDEERAEKELPDAHFDSWTDWEWW